MSRDISFLLGMKALFDGIAIGVAIMLGVLLVMAAVDAILGRKKG